MISMVAERLWGSIPMMTVMGALLAWGVCQQGGHRYFEQDKPLSSHSSPGAR
jgi:hypothetical protein